jgi:DNA-binding response OmpR family regulator
MDGLEALRQLQGQIPVILVTGRQRHFDEVLGLELGAEDYITKPFEFDILLARVRTVLRRSRQQSPRPLYLMPLVIGDLRIDAAAHTVTVAGKSILFPPREFRLLQTLAMHAGQAVPTENLIARVWGAEYGGEPQIVYVHIRALREKLEQEPARPQRILTMRGIGYRLVPQEV